MNKQLVENYKRKSFARFMRNETNYELLVKLVVDDCLEIIETSKHPGKLAIAKLIKEHYGYNESIQV